MRFNKIIFGRCVALVLTLGLAVGSLHVSAFAQSAQTAETVSVAVGPQYYTTHVYVAPEDFDRFVAIWSRTWTKRSAPLRPLAQTCSSLPSTIRSVETRLFNGPAV